MSRRMVRGGGRFEAVFGWDRPMRTFFAMVYDRAAGPEGDEELAWVGTDFDELPTVEALEDALRAAGALALELFPDAELPAELRAGLEADRAREGERPRNHPMELFARSAFGPDRA